MPHEATDGAQVSDAPATEPSPSARRAVMLSAVCGLVSVGVWLWLDETVLQGRPFLAACGGILAGGIVGFLADLLLVSVIERLRRIS
jgi:hypothetical protein